MVSLPALFQPHAKSNHSEVLTSSHRDMFFVVVFGLFFLYH